MRVLLIILSSIVLICIVVFYALLGIAMHKASDSFVERYQSNTDGFVESWEIRYRANGVPYFVILRDHPDGRVHYFYWNVYPWNRCGSMTQKM